MTGYLKLETVLMLVTMTIVFGAELNGSEEKETRKTNCGVGYVCFHCEGNKTGSITMASGKSTQVCCKGCSSSYFVYEDESDNAPAFCQCLYDDVEGSVWKGEECNVTGMTKYGSFGKMPLCCPDPLVMVQKKSNGTTFVVECEKHGNCWRGSMCSNCSDTSSANNVSLCCPGCANLGKTISIGDVIGCHCLQERRQELYDYRKYMYVSEKDYEDKHEARRPTYKYLHESHDEDEYNEDFWDDEDDDDGLDDEEDNKRHL